MPQGTERALDGFSLSDHQPAHSVGRMRFKSIMRVPALPPGHWQRKQPMAGKSGTHRYVLTATQQENAPVLPATPNTFRLERFKT